MFLDGKTNNNVQWICSVIIGLLVVSTGVHANELDNTISWAGCGVTKKAFMSELAKAFHEKTGITVKLHGGGATRGIRDTVHKKVDMGGSCRMNLPDTYRREFHAELHPVAWDALVVITNQNNKVKNLSTDQVRGIYTGKITNWKSLTGEDQPIHLYIRRGKISGVGYAIRQYLFQDSNIDFVTPDKFVKRSSGPLEQAIEKDIYGIAITGISSARKRNVRIVSIDSKSPTYDNVMRGKYILYRPLYLVTSPTPSQRVREFVRFARSEQGRKIIRSNGTVPYQDAPNLASKMLIYGFDVN